jgi:cobalt/nickel transport system permease protein
MKKYVTRFYFVPFFSLIAVFPWAFLKEGKTLYSFYGLIITVEGAVYVGIFVLRVVACIGIVSLLLFTTRIPDLIYSLRKMRVPSLLIDIFVIVYRRTFTFIKELYNMLLGIESRTFVQKKRVKNAKKFIGNFMRRILVKNEDIYTAMRAKGFNGRFKVYAKMYEWKLHSVSYILLILLMVTVWVMIRL